MREVRRGEIRRRYSAAEVWVDGAVHVSGLLMAAAASLTLVTALAGKAAAGPLAAVAIYLATLFFSLGMSAAYNLWPPTPTKWLLRRFDHAAIYLLIAGTYTPFMVAVGTWGLLGAVWILALLGVLLKLLCPGRFDRLSILLYLGLGWSGVLVRETLTQTLPPPVLRLIVAGGLVYSLGVVFHVWERLRFQNAIWHFLVLTAAAIHFAAVWRWATLEA